MDYADGNCQVRTLENRRRATKLALMLRDRARYCCALNMDGILVVLVGWRLWRKR